MATNFSHSSSGSDVKEQIKPFYVAATQRFHDFYAAHYAFGAGDR
jgi:hypothetical protein